MSEGGGLALFEPAAEAEPETRTKGKEGPPRTDRAACRLAHLQARYGEVRKVRADLYEFRGGMAPEKVERWRLAPGSKEWFILEAGT